MNETAREDYKNLLAHWNQAFSQTEGDREQAPQENDWKELAPSGKLLAAAQSLKDCKNGLDYGSGSGWAGIIMAKSGCQCVTCADAAPNAKGLAECGAERFGVSDRLHSLCVSETWLAEVPTGTYDGLFCSNVLDVVPPEMAEEMLAHFARIVTGNAWVVIGLNFYMPPEVIEKRGLACREGNQIYMDGVLRLVSRTDEEWRALLDRHFTVDRLEHFAWPGEEKETRRLFYLRPKKRKPDEIVTERLRLSTLRPGDRDALLAILLDGEVSRTYMVPDLPTEEKKTALFQRLRALSENQQRFVYGIYLGEKLIGMIHDVSTKESEIELGYFICPAEKNRGYATETLTACLPALAAMGYTLVKAGAFAENGASLRVMEKCGLKRTGETEVIEYRGENHTCVYCAIRLAKMTDA